MVWRQTKKRFPQTTLSLETVTSELEINLEIPPLRCETNFQSLIEGLRWGKSLNTRHAIKINCLESETSTALFRLHSQFTWQRQTDWTLQPHKFHSHIRAHQLLSVTWQCYWFWHLQMYKQCFECCCCMSSLSFAVVANQPYTICIIIFDGSPTEKWGKSS